LLVIDPERELPVKSLLALFGRRFNVVDGDQPLLTLMGSFQKGVSQLTVVKSIATSDDTHDPFWRHSGIVAPQDILNSIVQQNIQEKEGEFDDIQKSESRVFSNAPFIYAVQYNTTFAKTRLSNQAEAVAVQAFLSNTQQELFRDVPPTALLKFLLEDCCVISGASERPLYRRGEPADATCLTLCGEVQIFAGHEAFKSTCTAWNFLGLEAVTKMRTTKAPEAGESYPVYVPDFTAYVQEGARLLVITQASFAKLLQNQVHPLSMTMPQPPLSSKEGELGQVEVSEVHLTLQ